MKKTTQPKNSKKPQKEFKCPQCGKSFQNAQGLSGHVRYLHAEPKRPTANPQPAAQQQSKVAALVPIASTGAHEHLQAAFAVLRQREREIEAGIARLEELRSEREIVQRELEAVKAALGVFGERKSSANAKVEAERFNGTTSLDTQETVVATEDSILREGPETSDAVIVPESAARGSHRQRSVVERPNVPRNGQPEAQMLRLLSSLGIRLNSCVQSYGPAGLWGLHPRTSIRYSQNAISREARTLSTTH
jgi:hypothetical protein